MSYQNSKIAAAAELLQKRLATLEDKAAILRATELKALYAELPLLPADQKANFGKELNQLKAHLAQEVAKAAQVQAKLSPIDVTAPFDANVKQKPQLLSAAQGSRHPLMTELDTVLDIFYRMGFTAIESRQLDDDYHMFETLNFPEGHPARDDFDTFMTTEGLIAPAHTSTMQNRILKAHKKELENGQPIAVVIPGRVYRNEDLDARHEHTFYQFEGIYVGKKINAGNLIATLKTFLEEYYGQALDVRSQPCYFPFTEPSFEFAISCPFCQKKGCSVCSYAGWIELIGCGMIHPNVLKMADIDPTVYTGFAWGVGVDRMVMMKYNIEDVRHSESGKLEFLRQFK
jgi:phenylalanyl-tRNA synthetase alpha chain